MEFRAGRWSNVLRNAAMSDPRSNYQIGKDAKIDQGQLSRFLRLGGGLSLEAAERLGWVLGVKLSMTGEQGEAIGVEMYEPPPPIDLTPSDDEPEPRIPIKATKMDNRPELVPVRVEKKPAPSDAVPPPSKPPMTQAMIAKRKRLGMSD